jgi:serine/threonine-protein kinase
VESPIALEIFEGQTRLGSTTTGIVSAPAGRHQLELVNSAVGYRSRQVVDIKAGQTASIRVSLPNGRLDVNAVPWAEVLIDGKSVGETPIGNHSISLGEHEIVFRHPQLGEVRRTVVVRSDGVTRVSANLER